MVSSALLVAALAGAVIAAPVEKRDTIPSYVLDYAPLVWLDSSETYFPGPIENQLLQTTPSVSGGPSPLTLNNLDQLNALGGNGGRDVSLNSKDDFTQYPAWLNGNKPDSTGRVAGNPSSAIVVNDYKNGTAYGFYFFWYPFNLGNTVSLLGRRGGNHVGDWEHAAIKFTNGVPESVWFSQHSSGQAFTYAAVEKQGKRVVGYSAAGSHATYAQPGKHDHTISGVNLPFNLLLTDQTSRGTLWDPTLSSYQYSYTPSSNSFTAFDGVAPTAYLNYLGTWGDPQLPNDDPRQKTFLGIAATALWTGGPTGPVDKQLNRPWICADTKCPVYSSLRARDVDVVVDN